MSSFATEVDVTNYIEGWQTNDIFSVERYLQRAEATIDPLLVRTRFENPPTQVIFLGSSGTQPPISGSYQLGFQGVDTAALSFNSTAQQIEQALTALSSIGTDAYGVPNAVVVGHNPYTVIWNTDWARSNYVGRNPPLLSGGVETYPVDYQVPLLTVDNSTLNPPGALVLEVPGRRINPFTDLDRNQQLALSRATCAQFEYGTVMGDKFAIRPQYSSVKGPDFTTTGKLPQLAPKARRELTGFGLLHAQGRAYAGYARRGVAKGWPTY